VARLAIGYAAEGKTAGLQAAADKAEGLGLLPRSKTI